MIVSYNWLREFVDVAVEPQQLATALVGAGLEVDAIASRAIPPGVTVGRVCAVEPHPNADRLRVCRVTVGEGEAPLTIVCGAPNVRVGLAVACATVGTNLGNGFVIAPAKLRGVESQGMLCSQRELGLGNDHDGIMELPDEVVPGTPLSQWFPDDTLFTLEITPDRGDCLSILGVAREVAAAFGKPLTPPHLSPLGGEKGVQEALTVTVDAPQRCPRYLGRVITGVTVAPSPLWLQDRLAQAGIRSINTVVDVTNYCMLAFGQPMHAFDLDRVAGHAIRVRLASAGERFATLDSVERVLRDDDLLICDETGGIALAGVMGGENTEIGPATTSVFLECAFFDPVGVRVTSRRLGLSSQSSYRFERGVDPGEGLAAALDTAAELLRRIAGGRVWQGRIDVCPHPVEPRTVLLRPARARSLLGVAIETSFMVNSLTALGIACRHRDETLLECTVPTFRHDITIEADLIEEIGRRYGYDAIPEREFCRVPVAAEPSGTETTLSCIRTSLAGLGLNELMTNSMTSEKSRRAVEPAHPPVTLLNPLNPDMAQMRTTMLQSHLQTVAFNCNRRTTDCRFFEIGTVFSPCEGEQLPRERSILAITLSGMFFVSTHEHAGIEAGYALLKGIIHTLASRLRMEPLVLCTADPETAPHWLHQGALLEGPHGITGVLGLVGTGVAAAFGVEQPVVHAALDLSDFLRAALPPSRYTPVTRYPALERDLCLVMPESLLSGVLESNIRSQSPLITSVVPFDVYRGNNLGEGCKSIAYRLRLEAPDRTLTESDAEGVCGGVVAALSARYGVTLRS